MALGTVKLVKQNVMGECGMHIVDVQLTSGANYTTGGSAFDVAQIPNAKGAILGVFFVNAGTGASLAAVPSWDSANKTIKLFGTAAGATGLTEATAGGDFSAQTCRALVLT